MKKFIPDGKFIQNLLMKKILSSKNLRLQDGDLKGIYQRARKFYEAGKYKEARNLFSTLALLDRRNPTYLYGLGSTCMLMRDYDSAITVFLKYATLTPKDPTAYYFISKCYEKKQDLPSTLIALQTAINCSGNVPKFQRIRNQAQLFIDNYTKKKELI